ncbi:MAG TPA: ankyrin repeat domain-containing protein [Usitatibacter sp.]|nr:ankyrin repeat domain-containing protein [Usitatibacter sp.]
MTKTNAWIAAMLATIAFSLAGAALAADPVQARKDLKAMGVEYNEQEFAKAAGNDDMTAVKLFLDAGMDVNSGGGAAIGLAAGRGKTKMVEFLLSKGAKPTSNALQYAHTRGHADIEKILRDAGAKD